MLVVEGSSEAQLFRHLDNHVFPSPYFRKYINYDGHTLFENVQNLF